MTDTKDMGDIVKPIAGAIVFVAACYFYLNFPEEPNRFYLAVAGAIGLAVAVV
jgi:hypothetical protein